MGRFLGVVGSVLLIICAFLPIITAPSISGISFMNGDEMMWQGILVIAIAVATLIAFVANKMKFEPIFSLLAVIIVGLFFLTTYMELARIDHVGGDAISRSLSSLSKSIGESLTLAWGWFIYIIALALMVVGSFKK